jgi:hypothetical protein
MSIVASAAPPKRNWLSRTPSHAEITAGRAGLGHDFNRHSRPPLCELYRCRLVPFQQYPSMCLLRMPQRPRRTGSYLSPYCSNSHRVFFARCKCGSPEDRKGRTTHGYSGHYSSGSDSRQCLAVDEIAGADADAARLRGVQRCSSSSGKTAIPIPHPEKS